MKLYNIKPHSYCNIKKTFPFFRATKQEIKNMLVDNNFVSKNELYQKSLTDKEREAIIAFYDPWLLKSFSPSKNTEELYNGLPDDDTDVLSKLYPSYYVSYLLQQPLNKDDIVYLQQFSEIIGDNVFKNNFPTAFITYKILSEQGMFESILEQAQNQKGVAKLLSNVIKNPPDNETLNTLKEYKSFGGFVINAKLRKFYEDTDRAWDKSDQEYLDEAFKIMDYLYQFPLDSAITIYRGDSTSILDEFKDKNGNKLTDKLSCSETNNYETLCKELSSGEYAIPYIPGFLSGCAEEKTCQKKINRQINWKLNVPKGIRAIYIDAFNTDKRNPNENEILLENGLAIKIKNAKFDLNSKKIYIEADVADILVAESENK